jgi:hypothetical protein
LVKVETLSLSLRFAAILVLLGFIALMEVTHFFQLFRLFTLIFVFLLLVNIASLLGGKLRDALLVLASLAFGLCLTEAAVDMLEAKTSMIITPGLSVRQPIIGWGPERAGRFHAEKRDSKTNAIVYGADYTIDSNLLRETHSSSTGPAIVFFGDSYTFGDGVNDAETLPQAFADSFEGAQRVLNLAFTGYGPQQFLRELQTGLFNPIIGAKPTLFIFMTAAWHAERTACKAYWTPHAPRYSRENDQIAFKGACNEGPSLWLREWLENTASYRWLIEPYRHVVSHDDVDLYIRILLAAVTFAKEKYGVPTLIPYLPVPEDYLRGTGFNNDAIIERLRQGGGAVIDVSLRKEEADGTVISIKGDGHPTPLANRARALLLKHYIEQHMSEILLSRME